MTNDTQPPSETIAQETLALAAEDLRVGKAERVTGRVRIAVTTDVVDTPVEMDLARTEMRVETVPIDRVLEPGEMPPVQTKRGETTVIPVLEEVVVVEKRLLLRAEVHVTPVTSSETLSTTVPLRRQTATVERVAGDGEVQATTTPIAEDRP